MLVSIISALCLYHTLHTLSIHKHISDLYRQLNKRSVNTEPTVASLCAYKKTSEQSNLVKCKITDWCCPRVNQKQASTILVWIQHPKFSLPVVVRGQHPKQRAIGPRKCTYQAASKSIKWLKQGGIHVTDDQSPQFSTKDFAKFCGPVCKITWLTTAKLSTFRGFPFVSKLSSIVFKNFSFWRASRHSDIVLSYASNGQRKLGIFFVLKVQFVKLRWFMIVPTAFSSSVRFFPW